MEKTEAAQPTWAELLGSNNWEGLLEPLNLSLRKFILRCGDFCQATYDAFNDDQNSKYCGYSRYGKNTFFQKVMLESASNFQIYSFLYAAAQVSEGEALLFHSKSRESWDRESNWIGYIAITTDEVSQQLGRREAYVVWRGTKRAYEWLDDLHPTPESFEQSLQPIAFLDSYKDDENVPKVMEGWLTIYVSTDPNSPFTKQSARTQLLAKIKEIRNQYKSENLSIIVTGHSLGASLSTLSAFDLVQNGVTDIPVSAIVFCCPKVGNKAFNDRLNQFSNLKVLHIRNKIDLIPQYPMFLGYSHTGIELQIDTRKSPSLKDSKQPFDWHNLEANLHVVAGWNGADGEFELKVKRSLALVNKCCGALKDEYFIPESWWIEKNKGMVLNNNGDWILAEPSDEDQPVPEF
ncbi:phospholipase A1-IIdelta-like [Olea europaea var. sylvestris]|uniref:phospholipase A1-IIdelta-like n=1 Tax=Olea europaea var. sylvestris TaxID=158386 RepID=UPI000C1CD0B2|nr:phospholipase A1-IIdelta-like [Olea europaea var. sylvestris]